MLGLVKPAAPGSARKSTKKYGRCSGRERQKKGELEGGAGLAQKTRRAERSGLVVKKKGNGQRKEGTTR